MLKRPHLHWFWRGTVAVTAACAYVTAAFTVRPLFDAVQSSATAIGGLFPQNSSIGSLVASYAVFLVPETALALIVYSLLTRHLGAKAVADGESHCRKCDYILRGITEPRCPECGERI